MENIEGIKIVHIEGLNPLAGASTNNSAAASTTNFADQVVNSALRYRGQAPLLDSLLKEVGINGGNINSFTNLMTDEPECSVDESAV